MCRVKKFESLKVQKFISRGRLALPTEAQNKRKHGILIVFQQMKLYLHSVFPYFPFFGD